MGQATTLGPGHYTWDRPLHLGQATTPGSGMLFIYKHYESNYYNPSWKKQVQVFYNNGENECFTDLKI